MTRKKLWPNIHMIRTALLFFFSLLGLSINTRNLLIISSVIDSSLLKSIACDGEHIFHPPHTPQFPSPPLRSNKISNEIASIGHKFINDTIFSSLTILSSDNKSSTHQQLQHHWCGFNAFQNNNDKERKKVTTKLIRKMFVKIKSIFSPAAK